MDRISRRRQDLEAAGQQSFLDTWAPAAPPAAEADAAVPAPLPPLPPAPRRAGPPLRIGVLGSGSGGNAVVVESAGKRILIDAGFSCRELGRRMAVLGVDPKTISAVVLTHEHQDHCKGADGFARRYKVPVLATAGTLEGAGLREERMRSATLLRSGEPREVAGFVLEPFLIPHDAAEPVGFVVEDPCGRRLGLVADIGCRTSLAWGRLSDLDVLVLETNHDLDMLRNGPYPWTLKQRVAGRHGHLSNREAAEGLPELMGERLSWVALYHLSRTNNLPALAAAAIGEVLDREGCRARLAVTEQFHPTPWMEVP
ncbi:MAG TPA: MBL fold metallo-hydrolase [Thermoanaerobaculia bacterium]|nr:MBL fold metallo-hydrolase [Thermoanaerobaculia bacterium]